MGEIHVENVMQSWCLRELAFWRAAKFDDRVIAANFAELNRSHRSIFLLEIADGKVRVRDKPQFYTRAELDERGSANSHIGRIEKYRDFIEAVLSAEQLNIRTVIALNVGDKPGNRTGVPVFGFQKERGSPAILLPDIDFLRADFYRADGFVDSVPYDEKTTTAFFVGGTTGFGLITKAALERGVVPRIRTALYFKDSPDVKFVLAKVNGCDSKETEDLIRSWGIAGPRVRRAEHYQHKFLISMDGHGATCQRVAVALKGNGVLLKYESPHTLYYFDRMMPWVHYVPIFHDSDVEDIIAIEKARPGTFEFISREANRFYNDFLTPPMIMMYAARLLATYAEIFPAERVDPDAIASDWNELADPPTADGCCDALAHIQSLGDQWFHSEPWIGKRGSGHRIEGFALYPHDRYAADNIEYQAMTVGGAQSLWTGSSTFCGARGKGLPVTGIRIRIGGADAASYRCSYFATFVNGDTVGPVEAGQWCRSGQSAPVESFRISIGPAAG